MLSVSAFIFSSILQTNYNSYLIYVIAGFVPWLMISQGIVGSSAIFINNENLIKKNKFNLIYLPISYTLAVLVDNLTIGFIYYVFIKFYNKYNTLEVLFFLISYLITYAFCYGIALVVSVLSVRFRDLQWMLQMALQSVLYLTPVYYKSETLVGLGETLINLNPITQFIELFQSVYLGGELRWSNFALPLLISISTLLVGSVFFQKNSKRIIYNL
jgi:ABC-type polysaccharide/polyol phosphate export permease